MTGLLIVSHSRTLARGVGELIGALAPDVPVVVVGGSRGAFGVSAEEVLDGWRELAARSTAAVALFDVGSSAMNLDNALEWVAGEEPCPLAIADAPLVEGAIAAAMVALTGGGADEVEAAAEDARGRRKRG